MQKQMDKRFDSMQQHIEQIAKRHDRMQWLIFLTIVTYFFKEKLAPLLHEAANAEKQPQPQQQLLNHSVQPHTHSFH